MLVSKALQWTDDIPWVIQIFGIVRPNPDYKEARGMNDRLDS